MRKLNATISLLSLSLLCGCSHEPYGTILRPETVPPDKTGLKVHMYAAYAPTLDLVFDTIGFRPVVIVNGQNTISSMAKISKGMKKAKWDGYCFTGQGAFTAHSLESIALQGFEDETGRSLDPHSEKPASVEVYYQDQQKKPVYWRVTLSEH